MGIVFMCLCVSLLLGLCWLCVKSGKEIYMCTESEVVYRGNDIHGKKD